MSASNDSGGWSSGSDSDSSDFYDIENHKISFRKHVETDDDDDELEANAAQPVKRKLSDDDEDDPSQIKRYKMTDEIQNEEVVIISDDETEPEKDEEVINESANDTHHQDNEEVIISLPGPSPMDWKVQRNVEESNHTHLDTEYDDHQYYFEYVDQNTLIVREKKQVKKSKNTKQKNRYEIISKESHDQGNEEVVVISDDEETEINEIPLQESEAEDILTREFQLDNYQFGNSSSVVNVPTVKEDGPTQNENVNFNVDDEDFDWLM